MLEKQAVKCLPCSPNLRFYIHELHETISFFQWVNDSNASECQAPVNVNKTHGDEWCQYNHKWKVKMTTTSQYNSEMEKTTEMEKLEKKSGKLSLERCSAGVTLLPVKSMTAVTLLDWELWDLWEPWGNLPSRTAPQSLLKTTGGSLGWEWI